MVLRLFFPVCDTGIHLHGIFMKQLTAFEKEAVRLALEKMFRPDGWFDMCTINQMCKLVEVIPPQRTMETLHMLHCIHWAQMSPTMRDEVASTVMGLFAYEGFNITLLTKSFLEPAVVSTTAKPGFLSRLLKH